MFLNTSQHTAIVCRLCKWNKLLQNYIPQETTIYDRITPYMIRRNPLKRAKQRYNCSAQSQWNISTPHPPIHTSSTWRTAWPHNLLSATDLKWIPPGTVDARTSTHTKKCTHAQIHKKVKYLIPQNISSRLLFKVRETEGNKTSVEIKHGFPFTV